VNLAKLGVAEPRFQKREECVSKKKKNEKKLGRQYFETHTLAVRGVLDVG